MAPRRCIAVCGAPAANRARIEALVASLDPDRVAWLAAAAAGRPLLGCGFDAVVVDLQRGLDADLLALAHGFVRGGGALVLDAPAVPVGAASLAVAPYTSSDVGHRLWARVWAALDPTPPDTPLSPVSASARPTQQQDHIVATLRRLLAAPAPVRAVLIAGRGRGKSAALGRALAGGADVAVTGPRRAAVGEVLRFAAGAGRWVDPVALISEQPTTIVIDEAAQLPVPLLQRIVLAHPNASLLLASTVDGYEGTGRGFVLRFLEWLRAQPGPVTELTLSQPIRWAEGDPLEAAVVRALALDARPGPAVVGSPTVGIVDRDRLAADPVFLRGLFGLLVSAHYRTTPGDLHRLLDAPNLAVHVVRVREQVVAATVVAREGGLSPERCAALAAGPARIHGHALPETLIVHAGRVEAGALSFVRSVRIATHPALRRQGHARRLVAHLHELVDPDLFGSVFGATPALISFRRACGYEVVRLGTSRGVRTGVPSVVMLRPSSDAGRALVAVLRRDLAWDLPVQWALLQAEAGPALEPGLYTALARGLGPRVRPDDDSLAATVARYAHTGVPYEAVAASVEAWLAGRALTDPVVRARCLERRPWSALPPAEVRGAMRALRRGVRAMLAAK